MIVFGREKVRHKLLFSALFYFHAGWSVVKSLNAMCNRLSNAKPFDASRNFLKSGSKSLWMWNRRIPEKV